MKETKINKIIKKFITIYRRKENKINILIDRDLTFILFNELKLDPSNYKDLKILAEYIKNYSEKKEKVKLKTIAYNYEMFETDSIFNYEIDEFLTLTNKLTLT